MRTVRRPLPPRRTRVSGTNPLIVVATTLIGERGRLRVTITRASTDPRLQRRWNRTAIDGGGTLVRRPISASASVTSARPSGRGGHLA